MSTMLSRHPPFLTSMSLPRISASGAELSATRLMSLEERISMPLFCIERDVPARISTSDAAVADRRVPVVPEMVTTPPLNLDPASIVSAHATPPTVVIVAAFPLTVSVPWKKVPDATRRNTMLLTAPLVVAVKVLPWTVMALPLVAGMAESATNPDAAPVSLCVME